ncbi:relaxase domain-containing protein [Nostoc sp. FACHB-87]|uniref:MobF family relaxase n=1 Tax=Nostocales TaxID=1161 RepID=UPI001686AB24|nr:MULTISPECIES: MobF family relaxase [Nostocales]MBD2303397.1 relaxase domain-containing protein [Nostoc sp. FACHB-190]MBD2458984.1 relaxase domain-containing protein [Nostoc sp. FACHB-87]MBD2479995.1 relaxase domain-containing protein [Anabaena sp. FACHB-83]MBD2492463.1 relaxase domain-containing protein [Aulosira sp. FACHB-615]
MLTAANVSSEMAVNYFIKNYYHQGKSLWSGKGASKLGLSGAVDDEDAFKNVIEGRTPDGKEQLNARVVKKGQEKERRAALDCTFSAPKSVSLMALVGGDTRLIDAHHQALKQTLELIEQRYAYTRVTGDNGRHRVKTGNLVVAQFDHIESRDLDPHLHTHCLLMNMTQTPDGKWLSLGNNEIFANKKFLGMAYQSYLAREVQKLGYEIEHRLHGQFDIKGFKEEDKIAFSKRRQQILAASGANSTWAEREKIWDQTRQRKEKLPESELKAYWEKEAQALGITFVKPGEPQENVPDNDKILTGVLDLAIAHCNERNVAFKLEDLEKFILEERLATDVAAIEPLVKSHHELIGLPGLTHQFTTMTAVRRELATIDLMQQGQGKVNAISHPEVVESLLQNTLLNQGQRKAVELATLTQDQFIAWQGVAGAGKTFALKELKAIAANSEYTIKGFAPSSAAAKVLSEELGVQSETVARLLVSESPPEIEPNQIWIVDEAGLLSAKNAQALLQRATLEQARLILVGDTRQLSAVEAGNPFKSLQQAGIKTAHLNESLRQKDPQLKLAVDLIAEGRIKAGFEHLLNNGSIKTVDAESKTEQIASDYIVGTPEQRVKTLVLAGTNAERLALTQAIRSKLKDEGTLGETATITQLQTKNLSKVQMRFAHNFVIGDVITPTRNYKRRGLEKGKLYEIVGQTTDGLTLKSDDGKCLEVDTAFDKAVYQRQEIEIGVGDRLQWKKNDRQLGRRNGQEFTVTAIALGTAQIQYLDGHTESISLREAQNLDYALVSTTYSSQGKTADRVLISADFTIGQESFYVATSRAKHELKIYTEDPTRLLELAQESKAKENALELLRTQVQSEKPEVTLSAEVSTSVKQNTASTSVVQPTLKSALSSVPTPLEAPTQTPLVPPILKGTPEISQVFEKPILKPKTSVPTVAFWTPSSAPCPNHIDPEHWQELVEKSAIHPMIAALNFKSLHLDPIEQEHEAWEYLIYSDNISRRNDGRLRDGDLRRYSHIEAGGWWCHAGVDPRCFPNLQPGEKPTAKIWGCYKPNAPRNQIDEPGKLIKYEHPPKTDLSIFLLDIPDDLADRIYKKHGVEPTNSDRTLGFWYCVWRHNLPIMITEGAKKAASLLSQGHAAIGVPGIYAGYRSKDSLGEPIKPILHDELAVFATPNRHIQFCFDYETKPKTLQNVEIATSRTGQLLEQQGAEVKVVTLPGPDKGVDDFIVAQSPLALEKVITEAMNLKDWQQRKRAIEPPRKLTPEERQQRLAVHLKQETINATQDNLELHLQQMIQNLDQPKLKALFIEVGKYVKGEKFTGEQVNELFFLAGQADSPLSFEQRMNTVRQLIRDNKAQLMNKLGLNFQQENCKEKHNRFRR